MKKKPTIYLLFFAAIIFISLKQHSGDKNSSQSPMGRTGAPGETTCASCHSGGSYTGQILFVLGDGTITEYTPGQTYAISFVADYNAPQYGFSITALNESDEPAGEFTVMNNDNTSKGVAGDGRQYIGHKNANDNNEWEFEWTAPASDVGNITFYYVINAANDNSAPSGDYIETGTLSLTANNDGGTYVSETDELLVTIFPNPAQEYFIIRSAGIINDISIIDISGRIIYNQSPNSFEVRIDNHWDAGSYILRITTAEGVFVRKLLVR